MADGELVVCFNVLFCPVANSTVVTYAVLKHDCGDLYYRDNQRIIITFYVFGLTTSPPSAMICRMF